MPVMMSYLPTVNFQINSGPDVNIWGSCYIIHINELEFTVLAKTKMWARKRALRQINIFMMPKYLKIYRKDSEMTQQLKEPSTNSDLLSLTCRTNMVKGENCLLKVALVLHTYVYMCTNTHIHIHMFNKTFLKDKWEETEN